VEVFEPLQPVNSAVTCKRVVDTYSMPHTEVGLVVTVIKRTYLCSYMLLLLSGF